MATTTVDPYKVLQESYNKRTEAINAQTAQQEAERKQREQAAQETLANANRGVYTTYKQQVNPYGSFASQNNFSSGVSDYYKNASYGTMLQGLGTNQAAYNDAMTNSNSLWQQYLAQKAGDEADALSDYNAAVLAQQKYDKEQEDARRAEEEAIRQYNLNLQLQQEKMAEDKRRYDQEWNYQLQQDALAKSAGSSGGGGSYRSGGGGGGTPVLFGDDGNAFNGWNEENGYAVEYKNGVPTGKKIKSNTTGGTYGGANNTSKGTNIVPTGGTGGKSTSTKTTTKSKAATYAKTVTRTVTQRGRNGQMYRIFYYKDGTNKRVKI